MITIQTVCESVPGLSEATLRHWLAQDWVRADDTAGQPDFADIDVARVRLIVELRTELEIEESTVPLVLSLLDQLYATRAQLRWLVEGLEPSVREGLLSGRQERK